MNKMYRVVFNQTLGLYQVASELVSSVAKSKSVCLESSCFHIDTSKVEKFLPTPKQLVKLLTYGVLLSVSTTVSANDVRWIGGGSNSWFDGSNWVGGSSPTATDDAIINNGSVFISGSNGALVNRIRLGNEANANAQLVINNGSILDLRGTNGWIDLGSENDTLRSNAALPGSNSVLSISGGSKVYSEKMALSASSGANSTVIVEGAGSLLEITSTTPWQDPLFVDFGATQSKASAGGLTLSAVTPNFELNQKGTKNLAGKKGAGVQGGESGNSTFVLRDGATLKINTVPTSGSQINPGVTKSANPPSTTFNYNYNTGIQLGQNFSGSGNSALVIGSPLGETPSAPGFIEFANPNAIISMGAGAVADNTAQIIFNHNDYSGNYRFDARIQLSPLISNSPDAISNSIVDPTQSSGNIANNSVVFAHGITYIPDIAGTTEAARLPSIIVQGNGQYLNSGVLRFDTLNLSSTPVTFRGGFVELNPTISTSTIGGIFTMAAITTGGPEMAGLNILPNQTLTTQSGVAQANTGVQSDAFRFQTSSPNPGAREDTFTLSGGGTLVIANDSRQLLNISRGAHKNDSSTYESGSPQTYVFGAKTVNIVDGSRLMFESPNQQGNASTSYNSKFPPPFQSGWENGLQQDKRFILPRYSVSLNRFLMENISTQQGNNTNCLATDPHNSAVQYVCSSRNDAALLVQNAPTYVLSDQATFELQWNTPFFTGPSVEEVRPEQAEILEFFRVNTGNTANLDLSIDPVSKKYATSAYLDSSDYRRFQTQWVLDSFPTISLDRNANRPAITGGGTIVKQGWVSLLLRGRWEGNANLSSYTGLSNSNVGGLANQTWYETHAYDGIQTNFIVEEGRYSPYHQLGAELVMNGSLASYQYNLTTRGGTIELGDGTAEVSQTIPDHAYTGFLRKDDSLHPVDLTTGDNRGYIVGPIVGGIDVNTGLPPPTFQDGVDAGGNPIMVSYVEGMYYNPNGYVRKVGAGSNLTLAGNLVDCTARGLTDCGDGTYTADMMVEGGALTVTAETFKGDVVMTAYGAPSTIFFNESGDATYNGKFLVDYGRFVNTSICTPSIVATPGASCPTNLDSDEFAADIQRKQRLPVWRVTSVVKKGAGNLTITDSDSYVGRIVVEEGTLTLASDALLNTRVQLVVKSNATLDITKQEAFFNVTGGWATVDANGDELTVASAQEITQPAHQSLGFVRLEDNSTLRAVLGGGRRPEITADVITIGNNTVAELGGLVSEDPNSVLKSSELTDIQYILMAARDVRGITGSFVNEQGGIATTLDYIVDAKLFKQNNVWGVGDNLPCLDPTVSTLDCQFYHEVYKVGSLALAWTEGNNETATGNFTINGNLAFEVDTTLEDRTDFASFETGWDGKTLRKKGTGKLILSQNNNTYNGDTVIDEGTISVRNDSQLGNGGNIYIGSANSKNATLQITGTDATYEYNKDNTGAFVSNNFYTVRPTFLNGAKSTVEVVEGAQKAQFSRFVTDALAIQPNGYGQVANPLPGGLGIRGPGAVELIGGFNYRGSTFVESGSLLLDFDSSDTILGKTKMDNFIGGMGQTSTPSGSIQTSGTLILKSDHDLDYSGSVGAYYADPEDAPDVLTSSIIRAGTDGKIIKEGNSTLSLYGASSVDWRIKEGTLIVHNDFANNVVLDAQANPALGTVIDFYQAAGTEYNYLGTIKGGLNSALRTTGLGSWIFNYNSDTELYNVDVADGALILSSETPTTGSLVFDIGGNLKVENKPTASLVIRDPNIILNVDQHFELGTDSNLEVAVNLVQANIADIKADSMDISDANLKVIGFSRDATNQVLKASAVGALQVKLLESNSAITGDFNRNSVGVEMLGPDYLYFTPEFRNAQKEYWLTNMKLTWFAKENGNPALANGVFTMAEQTAFDVDVVLTDQVANAVTGWNGKDLTTYGLGDLILSETNTYTGKTSVVDGGLILAPTNLAQSVIGTSSAVIVGDASAKSGAILTIKGETTQTLNNLSMVMPSSVDAAAPKIEMEDSKTFAKIQNTATTTLAGDLVGKGGIRLNNTSQATELVLTGKTDYKGYTYLDQGTLTLDGSRNTASNPDDYEYAQLVSHVVGKNGSTFNLKNGARLTGSIDPTDVNIDARSVWELVPDASNKSPYSSEINRLNLQGTVLFTDPQEMPLMKGRTLKALHWNGSGTNANVLLYTNLGADNSPTDKIIIAAGGTATGNTKLRIVNQGGTGSKTTGDGIMIVDATANGATTADAAFNLEGSRLVVDGVYDYGLFKGGKSGDLNSWFLRTEADVNGGDIARPEVPITSVMPAMVHRYGLMTLGTYHERMGAIRADNQHAWGRIYGESGEVRQDQGAQVFAEKGPGYDFDVYGTQVGVDVYTNQVGDNTQQNAGVYLAFGTMKADAYRSDETRAGKADMKGYSLGAYFTQDNPQGAYYDAVIQATYFNNLVGNSSAKLQPQSIKTDGFGILASIETGYTIPLESNIMIQPQAQLIFQRNRLSNTHDNFSQFQLGSAQSLVGRVGTRFEYDYSTDDGSEVKLFSRANLWYTVDGEAMNTVVALDDGQRTDFGTELGSSWLQLGFGVSGKLANDFILSTSFDYNQAIGGGNHGHSFGARINLKKSF